MKPLSRLLASLLVLGLVLPAIALAQDRALYAGEAPVANQEEAERTRALGPALLDALVRASGDPGVASEKNLAAVLESAPRLLETYAYRQVSRPGPGGVAIAQLYLVAQFQPAGVERALASLRRSAWTERPATLVFVVIDDGSAKRIASAGQVDALGALTDTARQRGIALKLPAMDTTDFAKVDPESLWDGAPASALAAAARYRTTVALIVRLARSGSGWTGRFTLVDGGSTDAWDASYADANSVLAAAATGLADRLARRYAIPAADRQVADYRFWVHGIESSADYAAVVEHLSKLSVVTNLQPEGADGDRLLLRATLGVTPTRLGLMLALQNVLALETGAPGEPFALRFVR